MSRRGTDFLYNWISANVPATVGANIISVAELMQKLFADAKAIGISSTEIEEDSGSVSEAILDLSFITTPAWRADCMMPAIVAFIAACGVVPGTGVLAEDLTLNRAVGVPFGPAQ
ncbi:DUF768 domain-containing protein [Mesorhizobium sp. LNHC209A00]|uniref:DUF768 domain-containing protein n=1 Tax=Mesorhizobium TaxID=68287 RepID=UPI0003D04908|nr:hypothetical protein X738_31325 [Mesorhizobium sp. LNHC209A00]